MVTKGSSTIWWDDFESYNVGSILPSKPNTDGMFHRVIGNPAKVSNRYSRNGKKSVHSYLNRKTDRLPFRTMSVVRGGKGAEIRRGLSIRDKQDMWYGFSIYIPKDFIFDYSAAENLAQWHGDNSLMKGLVIKGGKGPNVALRTQSGRWDVGLRYGPLSRIKQKWWIKGELPAVVRGQWHDFVFHMKWAHDNSGLLEMWHNGTKYISYKGQNVFNEEIKLPYFSFGIYKPAWRVGSTFSAGGDADIRFREVWHDEFRFARGANARREDVDPASYAN